MAVRKITTVIDEKTYEQIKQRNVSFSFLIRFGFEMLKQVRSDNKRINELEDRVKKLENQISQLRYELMKMKKEKRDDATRPKAL